MSFLANKDTIEAGDTVIMYLGITDLVAIKVVSGKVEQNRYGRYPHNLMIGKPFGSLMQSTDSTGGWCHLLHPTPELWTTALPHRTQILYAADISMIVSNLELRPGSVVCESGTGSGSLSHALIKAIAPTGHLHTFEFHEARATAAAAEFLDHGLTNLVTVKHADACGEVGFGLDGVADAVFLDLPQPWLAIDTAKKALNPWYGRLCSFSPCIEQVQRTCLKLAEVGFSQIQTIECIERPMEIKTVKMPFYNVGPIATPRQAAATAPVAATAATAAAAPSVEEQGAADLTLSSTSELHEGGPTPTASTDRKRKFAPDDTSSAGDERAPKLRSFEVDKVIVNQTSAMRGHTGYLTFATWTTNVGTAAAAAAAAAAATSAAVAALPTDQSAATDLRA